MDATQIEGLIALFERSSLTELDYTEADSRLRLTKETTDAPAPSTSAAMGPVAAAPGPTAKRNEAATPTQWQIVAGLTGTFFRSAAPGEPCFVNVGDSIREGQTVGIIEAMKMLNAIESDRDARVVRIEVEDGVLVEAGTVLMVLEPIGGGDV